MAPPELIWGLNQLLTVRYSEHFLCSRKFWIHSFFLLFMLGNLVQPSIGTDGFPAPPAALPWGQRSPRRLVRAIGAARGGTRVGRRGPGTWELGRQKQRILRMGWSGASGAPGNKREALSLVTALSGFQASEKSSG